MDKKTIGYWAATGLFCLALAGSGFGSVAGQMTEPMAHLGLAAWFPRLLGAWKLAGVVALLAPGFPRLKEWAYAGFTFTLTGAAIAHVVAGDGFGQVAAPLVFLGLLAASWALRPASRVLGAPGGV
jgi:hypothetical protein